ncbi:MAG: tetratricopeptide repeat protein [Candidatus Pseudobacter hemicellulosilyticus]|uniref:Tetratricopeptide repeat protein n=1 Tax=Candidatus Pseudobacter hemicellulosilyticus TaxID=3121375 RepID=A0AAJ6BIT6_9BACT|nr:MAG: tetratricopeptide repeat protein [Pseudobacter sp.]
MKALINILILVAIAGSLQAQQENAAIRKGNKLFREGQYDKALPEYEKAATQNPKNPVTAYNMGNARFRRNEYTDAEKQYTEAAANSKDLAMQQKAWYNKGVALSKEKKLQESIDAYKMALRLNNADEDARVNLQKALEEQRKQQQAQQQQKPKEEQQKQKQQQKSNPRPNNLDKKKIEQYLKSLQQKEQEIQQKMQQNRSRAAGKPDKDW